MWLEYVKAVFLGIVEGVTEFLPVSSTGHLLLVERFMNLEDEFWKTFAVLIQLGAIRAILVIYFQRLWHVAIHMFTDPAARRFVMPAGAQRPRRRATTSRYTSSVAAATRLQSNSGRRAALCRPMASRSALIATRKAPWSPSASSAS